MAFIFYNPNPENRLTSDCVIRAIAKVQNESWERIYLAICSQGYRMFDMPNSNRVWGEYLLDKGYRRMLIPDTCPNCYTIRDFCYDNPYGTFLLGTGSHVVAAINGDYYDTWDSGEEVPIYYWVKGA